MSAAGRRRKVRVRNFMRVRAPRARRAPEGWLWNNVHVLSDEAWWIRQRGAGRWRQEVLASLSLTEADLLGLPEDHRVEVEWMTIPPHPDESREVDVYWLREREVYVVRMYVGTEPAIVAHTSNHGTSIYLLDISVTFPGERISSGTVLRVLHRHGLPGRRSLKRRPKRSAKVAWSWACHLRDLAQEPAGEPVP